MKWMYGTVLVADLIILYYTATRGAFLGLVVGVFVTALLVAFFEKKNSSVRKYTFGVLGGIILLVGLFIGFKNSPFIQNTEGLRRMASISLTEQTTESRFMVWGMAIDGWKEHPILGWGQENFNLVFNKYYNPGMWSQEQWFDRAHDIFLDWLIAGGLLGLLSYLMLFVVAVVLIWRPENTQDPALTLWEKIKNSWTRYREGLETDRVLENSILTGLLVAYFIHNIFVFDNLFSYILFFSLLAFLHERHVSGVSLLTAAPVKNNKQKNIAQQPEKVPFSYLSPVVLLVLIVVMYVVNLKPIYANNSLIDALSPHDATGGFTQSNVDAFKTVFDCNCTLGTQEAREQLVQSAMNAKSSSKDEKLVQNVFDLARTQTLEQISEHPDDARSQVFAGMLFYNFGLTTDALEHFEKAHALSPKKQTIDSNLILVYINAKQFDKALAVAKESYELDTANVDAAKMYAVAAIAAKQQDLADKILTQAFGTALPFDDNVVNAYGMIGRYDKIITTFKNQLEKTPKDKDLLTRLAAAYVATGDKDNAIATLQTIMTLYPEFKEQGTYYIQQIQEGKQP